MVSLDYTGTIKDDDIIAWKSDRGWVYLTLLGVRAPINKFPQQSYKTPVKKIVIDDFNESIQVAILINKPILGYDILNSKSSPGTVVFIHTEMKSSDVSSIKNYINDNGASVFNVAQSSGFPQYNTNFKHAFDQARAELGPNSIFEFHGELYTTNHPGETNSMFNPGLTGSIKNGDAKYVDPKNMGLFTDDYSPIEEIYVDITTDKVVDKKMGVTDPVVENLDTQDDIPLNINIDKTQILNKDRQQLNINSDLTEQKPFHGVVEESSLDSEVAFDDFSMETKNKPKEIIGWFRKFFLKRQHRKQKENEIQILSNELADATNDLSGIEQIDENNRTVSDYLQFNNENSKPQLEQISIPEPETLADAQAVMDYELSRIKQIDENNRMASDYLQSNNENTKSQLEQISIPEPEILADVQAVIDYELSRTQEPEINQNDGWALSDYPNYDNQNFNSHNLEKETNSTLDFSLIPEAESISASSNVIKDLDKNVLTVMPLDPYDESLAADVMPIDVPMENEYKNINKLYPSQINIPENLIKKIPDEILMQQEWYSLKLSKMPKVSSGIRVTANREGVPIYIDGKLVGETPLSGPVEISPGWHQVSGLTPLYTKVLNSSGMEYVEDDPILRNNQLFGSRTVYVGPKSISVVNLRFNDIGDPPRPPISIRDFHQNMAQTEGGMMIGFPVIMALFGFITWGMI